MSTPSVAHMKAVTDMYALAVSEEYDGPRVFRVLL